MMSITSCKEKKYILWQTINFILEVRFKEAFSYFLDCKIDLFIL